MKDIKKSIGKIIFLLLHKPLLLFKFLIKRLKYGVQIRYCLPKTPVRKRINGVLFDFDFGLDPMIKEMYFDYYEPETIDVMKRVLKTGDVFIDIGANIGYLSAIGAGLVGKGGQVHSFEPVPQCFQKLKEMAAVNPDYRIIVNQCALGEKEETANIDITNLQNIGWNTMVPGLMKKQELKETLKVPVRRLDNYIKGKALNNISLIKIDVEGFELPALKGLSSYFESTNHRPIIICELCPGNISSLSGYTILELLEYMKKYSYSTYNPWDLNSKIDITKLKEDFFMVVFISRGSM